MPSPSSPSERTARGARAVRRASPSDLPELARLFPAIEGGLLREKLFANPDPRRFSYEVWTVRRGARLAGVMQSVVEAGAARAWLGLCAADGSAAEPALWSRVRSGWASAGVRSAEALTIPANYLTPGIEEGDAPAKERLLRLGFKPAGDCVNLAVELAQPLEAPSAPHGFELRRAAGSDQGPLARFIRSGFPGDWVLEAALAMRNEPPAVLLGIEDGIIKGFAAHSAMNRSLGWFGPMAVASQARGRGLGAALLHRCLDELGRAGHPSCVIPWVLPAARAFYEKSVPCRVDGIYRHYHWGRDE